MRDTKPSPVLGGLIRKCRRQLDLTLQELAERSGLSVGYLSQVERDKATPSLGALSQIAGALGLGLDAFISTSKPEDSLTRAATRPRFSVGAEDLVYETLGASLPGGEMSAFVIHIAPGLQSPEAETHDGEEMLFVLDGTLRMTLDGQSFTMGAGDSLHYLGSTPHSWINESGHPVRLLYAGTRFLQQQGGATPLTELGERPHESSTRENN